MKPIFILTILLSVMGCQEKVNKSDLAHLTGYWEIKKVTFPDGNKKEYTVNTSIDYIEIKDLKGYRKKVQPNFMGTYGTSNDAELFTVYEKNGDFTISYKTILSEWEEKIISISKNNFTVINEENIKYYYKRFEPLNLE